MAVFAVYIQKRTLYFGENRPFGNTYHFQTQPGEPFPDAEIAEFVAERERLITLDEVEFVNWRTWGPTDGDAFDNVMREDGELGFNGAIGTATGMYREACSLVVWPLSRSATTNRKRWLRKFLRLAPGASGEVSASLEGRAPLGAAAMTALMAYADAVRSPNVLGLEDSLCTEDGDEPVAPSVVRPFLYTRQIGR